MMLVTPPPASVRTHLPPSSPPSSSSVVGGATAAAVSLETLALRSSASTTSATMWVHSSAGAGSAGEAIITTREEDLRVVEARSSRGGGGGGGAGSVAMPVPPPFGHVDGTTVMMVDSVRSAMLAGSYQGGLGELMRERERVVSKLASMASQHHMSEHARSKHGENGSPITYVPLSFMNRKRLFALEARQAVNSTQQAWWIASCSSSHHERNDSETSEDSESPRTPDDEVAPAPTIAVANSSDLDTPPVRIQEEVAEAIAEPLTFTASKPVRRYPEAKTSQTNPIHVSAMIPPEMPAEFADQLMPTQRGAPVLFWIPEIYTLDKVAVNNTSEKPPPPAIQSRPPIVTWNNPAGDMLLLSALNGEASFGCPPTTVPPQAATGVSRSAHMPPPLAPPLRYPGPSLPTAPVSDSTTQIQNAPQVPQPPTPPRGVIRHTPRRARASSAPPLFTQAGRPQMRAKRSIVRNRSAPEVITAQQGCMPPAALVTRPAVEGCSRDVEMREGVPQATSGTGNHVLLRPAGLTIPSLSSQPQLLPRDRRPQGFWVPSDRDGLSMPDPRRLGNMLLSSCPGKKVRLDGPVRGRGAICRDVRADLKRIRDLGAGCVICCLDDAELAFLGAPWPEYRRTASELGLDVLRVPIPEGLPPLRTDVFVTQLLRVIQEYTLRGINVLAHCRGGLGRAGIVACCWMLILGVCGWKDASKCTCGKCTFVNGDGSSTRVPTESSPLFMRQRTHQPFYEPASLLGGESSWPGSMSHGIGGGSICPATLDVVERVIGVVRRRRSLKAVETFEQVRFLVSFVQYLDAFGAQSGA